MPSYLNSTTLIDSVKRRAAVPISQVTFQEADLLAFANEEIALGILPTILQYHEEYLVYSDTIALVSNVSSYPIPGRAIGMKLRDLNYVDNSGRKQEMARIYPEDSMYYATQDTSNVGKYFYLENNMIVLVPSVGASPVGSLAASYFMRPNQLVSLDRIATVSAIDRTTGIVTVDATPSSVFSVGGVLQQLDLLEVKGGHRTRAKDLTPTAISGTTITFTPSDIPSDLMVGDHVALAGECGIPQIPDDLHVMLAQRIAARCLESLGDTQGLTNANNKLQEMEVKTPTLIDNRVEGKPQKVINLRGPLRGVNRRNGRRV